jgi:hypothetical protein
LTWLTAGIQYNPVGAALVVVCALVLAPFMARDVRQWREARGVAKAEPKR